MAQVDLKTYPEKRWVTGGEVLWIRGRWIYTCDGKSSLPLSYGTLEHLLLQRI